MPILCELVPDGIDYGINVLVEFQPDTFWYETSLTIAARAVKDGVKTDYHTFGHPPNEVVGRLTELGLNVAEALDAGLLNIIDSYTLQVGLTPSAYQERGGFRWATQSLKVADWSIGTAQTIKEGVSEPLKNRLHIDENTGALLQYNSEKELLNFWQTRAIPHARAARIAFLHSFVVGIASDAFYKQMEYLDDGVIDIRSEEKSGRVENSVRVRKLRNRTFDSGWRELQKSKNGEVTLKA